MLGVESHLQTNNNSARLRAAQREADKHRTTYNKNVLIHHLQRAKVHPYTIERTVTDPAVGGEDEGEGLVKPAVVAVAVQHRRAKLVQRVVVVLPKATS